MKKLSDLLLDYHVRLQGAASEIGIEAAKLIGKTDKEVLEMILREAPKRESGIRREMERLEQLARRALQMRKPGFELTRDYIREQNMHIARSATRQTLLEAAEPLSRSVESYKIDDLRELDVDALSNIVDNGRIKGRTPNEWIQNLADADGQRITKAVYASAMDGTTPSDVQKMFLGSRGNNYKDGVFLKTMNQTALFAKTDVNAVSNEVRLETIKENADVIDGVRFIGTLDGRTCFYCGSNDGMTWKATDEDIANPPLHFGCRCCLVPDIKALDKDGNPVSPVHRAIQARDFWKDAEELYNEKDRKKEWSSLSQSTKYKYYCLAQKKYEKETGKPALKPAQGNIDFQSYFQSQSKEFQEHWLGKKRFELYNSGKLSIDDILHPQDGFKNVSLLKDKLPEKPLDVRKALNEAKKQEKRYEDVLVQWIGLYLECNGKLSKMGKTLSQKLEFQVESLESANQQLNNLQNTLERWTDHCNELTSLAVSESQKKEANSILKRGSNNLKTLVDLVTARKKSLEHTDTPEYTGTLLQPKSGAFTLEGKYLYSRLESAQSDSLEAIETLLQQAKKLIEDESALWCSYALYVDSDAKMNGIRSISELKRQYEQLETIAENLRQPKVAPFTGTLVANGQPTSQGMTLKNAIDLARNDNTSVTRAAYANYKSAITAEEERYANYAQGSENASKEVKELNQASHDWLMELKRELESLNVALPPFRSYYVEIPEGEDPKYTESWQERCKSALTLDSVENDRNRLIECEEQWNTYKNQNLQLAQDVISKTESLFNKAFNRLEKDDETAHNQFSRLPRFDEVDEKYRCTLLNGNGDKSAIYMQYVSDMKEAGKVNAEELKTLIKSERKTWESYCQFLTNKVYKDVLESARQTGNKRLDELEEKLNKYIEQGKLPSDLEKSKYGGYYYTQAKETNENYDNVLAYVKSLQEDFKSGKIEVIPDVSKYSKALENDLKKLNAVYNKTDKHRSCIEALSTLKKEFNSLKKLPFENLVLITSTGNLKVKETSINESLRASSNERDNIKIQLEKDSNIWKSLKEQGYITERIYNKGVDNLNKINNLIELEAQEEKNKEFASVENVEKYLHDEITTDDVIARFKANPTGQELDNLLAFRDAIVNVFYDRHTPNAWDKIDELEKAGKAVLADKFEQITGTTLKSDLAEPFKKVVKYKFGPVIHVKQDYLDDKLNLLKAYESGKIDSNTLTAFRSLLNPNKAHFAPENDNYNIQKGLEESQKNNETNGILNRDNTDLTTKYIRYRSLLDRCLQLNQNGLSDEELDDVEKGLAIALTKFRKNSKSYTEILETLNKLKKVRKLPKYVFVRDQKKEKRFHDFLQNPESLYTDAEYQEASRKINDETNSKLQELDNLAEQARNAYKAVHGKESDKVVMELYHKAVDVCRYVKLEKIRVFQEAAEKHRNLLYPPVDQFDEAHRAMLDKVPISFKTTKISRKTKRPYVGLMNVEEAEKGLSFVADELSLFNQPVDKLDTMNLLSTTIVDNAHWRNSDNAVSCPNSYFEQRIDEEKYNMVGLAFVVVHEVNHAIEYKYDLKETSHFIQDLVCFMRNWNNEIPQFAGLEDRRDYFDKRRSSGSTEVLTVFAEMMYKCPWIITDPKNAAFFSQILRMEDGSLIKKNDKK